MQNISSGSRFPLLGEPLSLDLVNTRVCRNGAVIDLLGTSAALGAWLNVQADRLHWIGQVSAADARAVRTLRAAIAELFRARRECSQPAAAVVAKVNQVLSAPSARMQLVWADSGPGLAPLGVRSRRSALLGTLAADATAVLTGPQAERLRKCAHPECILQFVADNPRRRWCSDALCGNRARVARHYRRQQTAE